MNPYKNEDLYLVNSPYNKSKFIVPKKIQIYIPFLARRIKDYS